MGLPKELGKTVLVKVSPLIFQVKKHLPEILVGTGAVSIAAGTVLACKAAPTAKMVWETRTDIVGFDADDDGNMIEREATEEEKRKLAISSGVKVVKLYAPGVGLIVGGTALLIAAKSVEHRRFTAALGAYSTLQAAFDEYRARVIEEGGNELDAKYLNGSKQEKILYVSEDEETGKQKKSKEEVTVFTGGESPYHRLFDECNSPTEWKDNLDQNKFFLECQQAVLNRDLQVNGRIFLNDVYKRLGFGYCEVGQFVGWLSDDIEGSKDGFIDFGIDYGYLYDEIAKAQAEGRRPEPSIWLNFNCDGEVWDKPLKKKRDAYL
jgi:hypothetical protein